MTLQKSVLVLDDDADLRLTLCELFDDFGARCVGVGSLDDMRGVLSDGVSFDLAILDVNLGTGQPSGVDAYRWLKEHAFPGRIAFLTGHARSFPGVAEAYALGVRVLQKPGSIEDLMNLLGEA
jgi:DNA-binding NtrC family response regulator